MSAKNKKNKLNLLGMGALAAFLSLTTLAVYLVVTLLAKRSPQSSEAVVGSVSESLDEEVEVPWRTYTNEAYGYEISHPGLLYQREFVDSGGYEHFVRFEETQFSLDKGVAVGVSLKSAEEELNAMKSELSENAELVEERSISVAGLEAAYILFRPSFEGGEERAIAVFEGNGATFSVSTVPEQMDKVLQSFKFLN